MKTRISLLFILLFTAIIISCGRKTTPAQGSATNTSPAPAQNLEYKKWALANMSSYHRGGTYYAANCQKCHKLKNPKSFTEAEWKDIMPAMQRKAKIADSTASIILNYVLASKEGVEDDK